MRNLISKEELKRRELRNQRIILWGGIFLILIMLFSSVGYSFLSKEPAGTVNKGFKYNGIDFSSGNGYFVAEIDGNSFAFSNDPRTTEKFNSKVLLSNNYLGYPLYIDSEDGNSIREIKSNLWQIALRIPEACYGKKVYTNISLEPENSSSISNETIQKVDIILEKPCEKDVPIRTCDNRLIVIREANESSILQEENCVFISGPKSNLSMITDAFLLKTLGIDA